MSEARKKRKWLMPVGVALALVVVVALVYVRLVVAGTYNVPSAAMVPTIALGSRVAISKLDREPARGRVIVFHFPEKPNEDFVKRIVGLPGDTIAGKGSEILVNGKPIPRCLVGTWSYDDTSHSGELWLETLDGAQWLVFHDAASPGSLAEGPWTVAPGEVFVVGDNRENSHDSRMWFGGKGGGVPLRMIVGTVIGVGVPTVPKGAEALKPALDACLTKIRSS